MKTYSYDEIRLFARGVSTKKIKDTKEVLKRKMKDGHTVAHELAKHSWVDYWVTEDKEILIMQDSDGWSVAHHLAHCSRYNGWTTKDKDILLLEEKEGWTVAHQFAVRNLDWNTEEVEILSAGIKRGPLEGQTVEDTLEKRSLLKGF